MKPRSGTCRGCGHPVIFAQSDDEGLLVLEAHESAGGPDRYTIWGENGAVPVPRRTNVRAHARHTCPSSIDRRPNPLK